MATSKKTQRTPILYWLVLAVMFAVFTLTAAQPVLP
jgi:hypothetical protein